MAHGAPDYSNVKKQEYSFRLDDLGELAARLGSPLIYDRRGEVLFVETFGYGFAPWQQATYGVGGAITLDADRYHTDGFSALLRAGSDGLRGATIQRSLPLVNMLGIGFELRAIVNEDVEHLKVALDIYDGTTRVLVYIIYFAQTDVLKLFGSNAAEQTISSGLNLSTVTNSFNFLKFSIDWANKTYLRGLFNGNEIDISTYDVWSGASAVAPYILLDISVKSIDGENGEVFVDNIIITRNED